MQQIVTAIFIEYTIRSRIDVFRNVQCLAKFDFFDIQKKKQGIDHCLPAEK